MATGIRGAAGVAAVPARGALPSFGCAGYSSSARCCGEGADLPVTATPEPTSGTDSCSVGSGQAPPCARRFSRSCPAANPGMIRDDSLFRINKAHCSKRRPHGVVLFGFPCLNGPPARHGLHYGDRRCAFGPALGFDVARYLPLQRLRRARKLAVVGRPGQPLVAGLLRPALPDEPLAQRIGPGRTPVEFYAQKEVGQGWLPGISGK